MLILFKYLNDQNLFEQNLLFTLVIGSLPIIGFSIYYFKGYLTKTPVNSGTETTSLEIITPDQSSNFSPEQVINTDGTNLVETSVITEEELLYDFLTGLI